VWFLYRLVSPDESVPHPPPGLPIYGRGPFSEEAERQLLAENRIDALVTRNSGGTGTYAKIAAARAAAIRVVMIDRPQPPDGERVETVQDALRWIAARTA
jgi:precorrin-6A/cobalt-precorrin-6A reductase